MLPHMVAPRTASCAVVTLPPPELLLQAVLTLVVSLAQGAAERPGRPSTALLVIGTWKACMQTCHRRRPAIISKRNTTELTESLSAVCRDSRLAHRVGSQTNHGRRVPAARTVGADPPPFILSLSKDVGEQTQRAPSQ